MANIILPDGANLNREMVRLGPAWWFRKYSKDDNLGKLEAEARQVKRGLWADPKPIAPWHRRDQRRKAGNKTPASTTSEPSGWWLNTSIGVRHNSRCEEYGKTKRGRPCGPDERKACGTCGG